MIDLKPLNVLLMTGKSTKTDTLFRTFQKPVGEENPYVRFVCVCVCVCVSTPFRAV